MSQAHNRYVLAAVILLTFAAMPPLHAQNSAIDSTLYTTYSGSPTSVSWMVCGSTTQTEGCYATGSLGPFIGVGAMLEGNPSVKGNVVTRAVYVVDSGSTNSVRLYVYKKTDTVTADFDTVVVTLGRTITLPLTGGSTALVSMAANNGFLFIGTDQSSQSVEIRKSNLSITQVGGSDEPPNVNSITADQYGYVTVTGSGGTLFGPDGLPRQEGGGFLLGTTQAVSATSLLGTDADARRTRRLSIRPKALQ